MRVPAVKKRRHYDHWLHRRKMPELNAYYVSDSQYVEDNLKACLWFLENRDKIAALLKGVKLPR